MSSRPSRMASTAAEIGISRPCAAARRATAPAREHALDQRRRVGGAGPAGRRPRPIAWPKAMLREVRLLALRTRSPRPESPIRVSRRPPSASPEPRQLGEAAGDDRSARVLAQAAAGDDAGGDREHVLERRRRPRRRPRPRSSRRESCRCSAPRPSSRPKVASAQPSVAAAGRPSATSPAKFGPDSTAQALCGHSPADHLAQPGAGRGLEALGADHQGFGAASARQTARTVCAGTVSSTASAPATSPRSALARIAGSSATSGR